MALVLSDSLNLPCTPHLQRPSSMQLPPHKKLDSVILTRLVAMQSRSKAADELRAIIRQQLNKIIE